MKNLFFMMIASIIKFIKSFETVKTDVYESERRIDPPGQNYSKFEEQLIRPTYQISPLLFKRVDTPRPSDENFKTVTIEKIKYFLRTGSLLPGEYPITLFNEDAIRTFLKEHGETVEAIEDAIRGFFNKGHYFVTYAN
jgi:hypothetical protein